MRTSGHGGHAGHAASLAGRARFEQLLTSLHAEYQAVTDENEILRHAAAHMGTSHSHSGAQHNSGGADLELDAKTSVHGGHNGEHTPGNNAERGVSDPDMAKSATEHGPMSPVAPSTLWTRAASNGLALHSPQQSASETKARQLIKMQSRLSNSFAHETMVQGQGHPLKSKMAKSPTFNMSQVALLPTAKSTLEEESVAERTEPIESADSKKGNVAFNNNADVHHIRSARTATSRPGPAAAGAPVAAVPSRPQFASLASTSSVFGGQTEHQRELYDSFFQKVQRKIGQKGYISARKAVGILESSKVAREQWSPEDVQQLFYELHQASSKSNSGWLRPNESATTTNSSLDRQGDEDAKAKVRVLFREFRYAVLHLEYPNHKFSPPAERALHAFQEVAVAEDAMDIIMNALEIEMYDLNDQEMKRSEKLLDLIMTAVIIANAVCIGVFATPSETSEAKWGMAETLDSIFTALFALEILFKLHIRGWRWYIKGSEWKWNWFDLFIVCLGILDIAMTLLFATGGSVNTSSFLLLRLIRLLRLARLERVFRVSLFRELKLMVNGMRGLIRTLSCTIVIIFFTVYLLGILLVQVLGDVKSEAEESVPGQMLLFSTVPRSMYTVFRCLLVGDCAAIDGTPIALHVSEGAGWTYAFFYCGASIFINYGIGSLITALVVDSTLNAAKTEEFRRSNREEEKHRIARKIHAIAEKLQRAQWGRAQTMVDKNETLFVTKELFEEVCRQKDVKALFDEVEVDETDRSDLFEAIDADGNGRIELGELVEGIMKMRGAVRKADIVATRLMTGSLLDKVFALETTVAEGMLYLETQLQTVTYGVAEMLPSYGPLPTSPSTRSATRSSDVLVADDEDSGEAVDMDACNLSV